MLNEETLVRLISEGVEKNDGESLVAGAAVLILEELRLQTAIISGQRPQDKNIAGALRTLAAAHPDGIPGLLRCAGVWEKPLGRGIWAKIEPLLVEAGEEEPRGPTFGDILSMGGEFPELPDPRGDREGVDGG